MKHGLVALAPLLALLLTACGPGGSAETEPAEGSAQASAEDSGLVVGDTATTTEDGNTLTVLSYESPVPPAGSSEPEPGFEFSAIEVEGCASRSSGKDFMNVGSNAFVLQSANGERIPPETLADEDAEVMEPILRTMNPGPGKCERGFVVFQTPRGERPERVVFEEQFTTEARPIEWAVPDE